MRQTLSSTDPSLIPSRFSFSIAHKKNVTQKNTSQTPQKKASERTATKADDDGGDTARDLGAARAAGRARRGRRVDGAAVPALRHGRDALPHRAGGGLCRAARARGVLPALCAARAEPGAPAGRPCVRAGGRGAAPQRVHDERRHLARVLARQGRRLLCGGPLSHARRTRRQEALCNHVCMLCFTLLLLLLS